MSLMMMKTNPITPPRELVREWYGSEDCPDGANALANYLCTQAAQWGADQELEACCEWLEQQVPLGCRMQLRAARRPKPPSLKEQALEALGRFSANSHTTAHQMQNDFDLFRRALDCSPSMTDLSPATQAIIDASNCAGSRIVQLHIADALRALAVRINGADAIRQDVLDIADELENQ
jgi:hypothetical protein